MRTTRELLSLALVVLLLLSALVLMPATTQEAKADVPSGFPSKCGLDFSVVLDECHSIALSNDTSNTGIGNAFAAADTNAAPDDGDTLRVALLEGCENTLKVAESDLGDPAAFLTDVSSSGETVDSDGRQNIEPTIDEESSPFTLESMPAFAKVIYEATNSPPPAPGLTIVKLTNGSDDLTIAPGNAVTWTYTVTNTGNVPLYNVVVTDSDASVTPVYVSGDTNADGILDTDEVWVYEAYGIAIEGNYSNIGYADAKCDDTHVPTAQDESAYFGVKVLASGGIGDEVLLGNQIMIGNRVWYDANGNGIQDAGEYGIAGATVRITGLDGQDVDSLTLEVETTMTQLTTPDGFYLFSGLPEGSYRVETRVPWIPYVDPDGKALRFTTASSFTISVLDGDEALTANFGVVADTLPFTGLNTDTLLIAAIMLLAVGAGAVLLTTRRNDQGKDPNG